MQPSDPRANFWRHEEPEPEDTITGMYAPEHTDDNSPVNPPVNPEPSVSQQPSINDPVKWSAEEYIHEEKNITWFIVFTAVALALIAIDIFLFNDFTFSIVIAVMAVAIIVYSRRPPRLVNYTLSGDQGLYIDEQLYHFNDFKSFGLINDRGHHSILLIPIKRFSLGVTVYFPEEVGERIVDILGARLPMENRKLDLVDIIAHKLRL